MYFFAWVVAAGVERGSWLHLIYLTNWCFIAWELYLIVSAVTVLVKFIFHVHLMCKHSSPTDAVENLEMQTACNPETGESSDSEAGEVDIYHEWRVDKVAWYQKIQWFLFNLGPHLQVIAVILYWGFVYDPNGRGAFHSDSVNFHVHLIGGIVAMIDIWIAGIVMNIYHLYEVVAFGVVYMIFSGIYYAADGRDQYGNRYVYPVLDYGSNPGRAVGIAVGSVFGLAPAVHLFLYAVILLRRWLACRLHKACFKE